MGIDLVVGWLLAIQNYFFSFCRNISFQIKKFAIKSNSGRISDKHQQSRLNYDQDKSDDKKIKTVWEIPGPKCLPIVGSLFEFNKFGSRRVHELSAEHHKKYGDIFRERIFSQDLVFIANTDLLKEWMSQEGKLPVSIKQEPTQLFAEECPYLKRGLFFRNGDEWPKLRKLSHMIVNKNAADYEEEGLFDTCQEFIDDYIHDLEKVVQHGNGRLEDFETKSYMIAVGSLMGIVYGRYEGTLKKYTGTDISTLANNAKQLNVHHQNLLEKPARLDKWFGSKDWIGYSSRLKHNLMTCKKFGRAQREDIIKSLPETTSMRTHGLLYKTMSLNASLTDIDDLLCDFAVDTKEPIAASVMFVTYVLSAFPDIQEKILAEINMIYPCGEPVTYGKLKFLEYTEGFIKEILRLFPVAPFSTRVVSDDTIIGGYCIPPGTLTMFSTYVVHRDSRYFTDPLKIIPERWMQGKNKIVNGLPNRSNNEHPYTVTAFAGFGLKKRICPGQNLAISILCLYLAKLVRAFKLQGEMPEYEMRTVLYPKNLTPIQLKLRS